MGGFQLFSEKDNLIGLPSDLLALLLVGMGQFLDEGIQADVFLHDGVHGLRFVTDDGELEGAVPNVFSVVGNRNAVLASKARRVFDEDGAIRLG